MSSRWCGDLGKRCKQSQCVLPLAFAKLPHRAARPLPPVGQTPVWRVKGTFSPSILAAGRLQATFLGGHSTWLPL
jgi:hypothetical protein